MDPFDRFLQSLEKDVCSHHWFIEKKCQVQYLTKENSRWSTSRLILSFPYVIEGGHPITLYSYINVIKHPSQPQFILETQSFLLEEIWGEKQKEFVYSYIEEALKKDPHFRLFIVTGGSVLEKK